MIAIDSVSVVPDGFAMPAGLSPIASPVSTDAIAAPAREVEIAPEPGKYKPPACAAPPAQTTTKSAIPPLAMSHLTEKPVVSGAGSYRSHQAHVARFTPLPPK